MRAKRRLIDTLLAPLSLSSSLSLSFSLRVQLCRGALHFIDLQLLTHSEFFKVQFSKTIFLTVLRAWITAHLFLRRLSGKTGTIEVGLSKKKKKRRKKSLKCIAPLCFQYYQCLLQINSPATTAPALHPECYQSLLQIDSQKYNHKKQLVI